MIAVGCTMSPAKSGVSVRELTVKERRIGQANIMEVHMEAN